MRKLIKNENGFVGIYIMGMILILVIATMAVYYAVAGEAYDIREYALSQIEQAGEYTLYADAEYDLTNNKFVVSANTATLEQTFESRINLNHYTITKFQILDKGAPDPMGYPMAQPGIYVQMNLPMAGYNIPVGEEIDLPPYNSETKVWVK